MAWTMVETPNAKYVLLFSSHIQKTEKSPLQFDALILEAAESPQETASFRQYKNLVQEAVEGKKQVWITDAGKTRRADRRAFLGRAVPLASFWYGLYLDRLWSPVKNRIANRIIQIGLLSPFLYYYGSVGVRMHKKQITRPKLWQTSARIDSLIGGKGSTKIRNVITAEKCESFVAPMLQRELGRKPVIAMVWGGGHYGIKELLENPAKRHRILAENQLERHVKADYPRSIRFKVDNEGKITSLEEFPASLEKPKPSPKPKKPTTASRRALFQNLFRRK